ncbi:MAG: GNAT family N-acetyltransferase [Cytophagales bacterium]|nr:GNAT family N-acetyltransferase [Cytophagales bacterium]
MENLFYTPTYLKIQAHEEVRVFKNEQFRVFFSINNGVATSLPRGLFGSFEILPEVTQADFSVFGRETIKELKNEAIYRIEVIHPSDIYEGFVTYDWLEDLGFSEIYSDTNHHIELSDFEIHEMEKRKLKKLSQAELVSKELMISQLPEVYDFLVKCRKEIGLKLNISLEKLTSLFQAFPDRYCIFGAHLEDQLVSAVITVQTAPEVVYYYLPGTAEKFKKESPMVGLVQHLVDHFKHEVRYLDLGVSSIEGRPQEGLISFKERMGGVKSLKKTFVVRVC